MLIYNIIKDYFTENWCENVQSHLINILKLIIENGTVIFLHGLDSNSEFWESKLQKLFSSNEEQQRQTSFKIFCPQSPQMPISLYKGKIKNAWFNVFDYLTSDDQGICNAAKVRNNIRKVLCLANYLS